MPHVLLAEEEDTTVKGKSSNVTVERKKALEKWKEGIEVIISYIP